MIMIDDTDPPENICVGMRQYNNELLTVEEGLYDTLVLRTYEEGNDKSVEESLSFYKEDLDKMILLLSKVKEILENERQP